MTRLPAPAKVNLALVVGARRSDGRHEVATVLQRIDLTDRVTIDSARSLSVSGFAGDTLVRRALEGLAAAAGVQPRWHARIEKRISEGVMPDSRRACACRTPSDPTLWMGLY